MRIFACAAPIMQADTPAIPSSARLPDAVRAFSQRHWRYAVIAMLALLHVVALRGVADGCARALLLAHLGLLLLWQPLVRGDRQVTLVQALCIALFAAAVVLWLDWWMLATWTVVLAGLVGGKVYLHQARWQRRYYLLMFVYLLALLVVIVLPEIAPRREIDPQVRVYAAWGLPVLFLLMALTPAEPDSPEAPEVIDYFYSIFLMLVLGVVVLGSFAFMTLGRTGYLEALTYIVFVIAGIVLVIGLAWNPRTGYAGLNVFVSRYLFSIGLPIERWLQLLAELSHAESRPERFLAESVAALARMPSVSGAQWSSGGEHGEVGARTPYTVEFSNRDLALAVYSRYRTSPALHGHLRLLGQLLGEFYRAKLREEELRRAGYMQAVHETGARVTHDVKNLLQSLNVLCSVAVREDADSPEALALVRRQLPAITQRLAATLDKLQRPGAESAARAPARDWWESLVRQYQGRGGEGGGGGGVGGGAAVELRVCDTGQAVPADLVKSLLRAPVPSDNGLGIGLYQAARQAEAAGYVLRLESNRDGDVCFCLRRAAD